MNRFIVTACLLTTGCVSVPSEYIHVSSRLAERTKVDFDIHVSEISSDSAVYVVRANDGRQWKIPTAVYVPSKPGIDAVPMRDGCDIYQKYSKSHSIIGFQENCGGEWISRQMLFIKNDTAHLFEIVTAHRSRKGLRDGEPIFWYTWSIDSILEKGVVLEGIFFPWKDLRCRPVGNYKAEQD